VQRRFYRRTGRPASTSIAAPQDPAGENTARETIGLTLGRKSQSSRWNTGRPVSMLVAAPPGPAGWRCASKKRKPHRIWHVACSVPDTAARQKPLHIAGAGVMEATAKEYLSTDEQRKAQGEAHLQRCVWADRLQQLLIAGRRRICFTTA